jgi:hypothetical protein
MVNPNMITVLFREGIASGETLNLIHVRGLSRRSNMQNHSAFSFVLHYDRNSNVFLFSHDTTHAFAAFPSPI